MPQDLTQIINAIKNISLFDGLDDTQLERVASVTRPILLKEGDTFRQEGKSSPFFVVVSGKVRYTRPEKKSSGENCILKHGDFFGADALFRGKAKSFSLVALKPTLLFSYPVDKLRSLVNAIPSLTRNIKRQLAWYSLIRSKHFNWLGDEETVKLVCRKHPAYLFVTELMPLLVMWVGIVAIVLATLITSTSFRLAAGFLGIVVVGAGVLWGLWRYFDWGNDYYILTDERIVWLERTLGIYDSRQEAPLVAIKAGETKSSLLGRWLGYGDVITQSFMGQVLFRHIRNPGEIKVRIDFERKLAVERQMATDIHAIEGTIRQKIEPSQATTVPMPVKNPEPGLAAKEQASQERKPVPEKLSFWQSLFIRFQTRIESGGTITYRKHLYVLFRKTWFPAGCVVGLAAMTALLFYWRASDQINLLTPSTILLLGIFLAFLAFLWWLYNFIDWSNDIYRVTADKIIDSERKPLGDEITKSAPLENIIGMDYERIGILGVVLNFGNVVINVGADNKFIFYGIHNPARAQRDIFNYMNRQRSKKQREDTLQEQERVSSYIAAYHRQAEELRRPKKPPQF